MVGSLIQRKHVFWTTLALVSVGGLALGALRLVNAPENTEASAPLTAGDPETSAPGSTPPTESTSAPTSPDTPSNPIASQIAHSPPSIDLDFNDASASDYRALKALAEKGDGAASAKLYTVLASCRRLLNETTSVETIQGFASAGVDVGSMLANQERELEHCSAIDAGDIDNRGQWLSKAADSGVLEAQLLFVIDGEALIGDARERLADPQAVIRYRATALRHLGSAASSGNLEALIMLSDAYRSGVLGKV